MCKQYVYFERNYEVVYTNERRDNSVHHRRGAPSHQTVVFMTLLDSRLLILYFFPYLRMPALQGRSLTKAAHWSNLDEICFMKIYEIFCGIITRFNCNPTQLDDPQNSQKIAITMTLLDNSPCLSSNTP